MVGSSMNRPRSLTGPSRGITPERAHAPDICVARWCDNPHPWTVGVGMLLPCPSTGGGPEGCPRKRCDRIVLSAARAQMRSAVVVVRTSPA